MSSTYIHPSVSRAALSRMFDAFREAEVNCHTFEIYQGETQLVRIAAAPYSCSDKRENYSLSKSFTSAAIGIAVTEGVLSLNDRIVDILPDKLPEIVSENLKKLTVRHLLTLSAGHEKCSFLKMSNAEDAARAFLSEPFPNTPGTAFCYDTGATCMLGIVLERVTGMNPLEYLALKFFPLAGIENVYWNTTRDGSTECGVGLHASCDDIAKFGILFAGGGVYNGKRLISEEYVREAGSPQICYLNNGDAPSRLNGYGYQFWMKEPSRDTIPFRQSTGFLTNFSKKMTTLPSRFRFRSTRRFPPPSCRFPPRERSIERTGTPWESPPLHSKRKTATLSCVLPTVNIPIVSPPGTDVMSPRNGRACT